MNNQSTPINAVMGKEDTELQTWFAERNLFINDKILRLDGNGGEKNTWEECRLNLTYMKLAKEFPAEYRSLDGTPLIKN